MTLPQSEHGQGEMALMIQNLPQGDQARAVAFLGLGRDRLRRAWKIVTRGNVDVLLVGSDSPDTVPGLLDDPTTTLQLGEGPSTVTGSHRMLSRPLQYDDFIDALHAAEGALPDAPSAGDVAAPPADPTVPTARPFTLSPQEGYRLRRWPPSRLLLGHRYHSRLAGFLSVRHASVGELSRLSNVALADCHAFLLTLGTHGLLDVKRLPEAVSTVVPADTSKPVEPQTAGLFQKLRRRWGLGSTSP